MKKLLMCFLALFMITGCSTKQEEIDDIEETVEIDETEEVGVEPKEITMDKSVYDYVVSGETKTIQRGDRVRFNRWNNRVETNLSSQEIPVFYKNITIGSPHISDIVHLFEIEAGYACVNREIDPYEDGCTDVVIEIYQSLDFIEKEFVLDAYLYFYIENKNDTFMLLSYQEGKEAWEKESDRDILRISIDFVGECFAQDEGLDALTPIEINIERK